MAKFGELKFSVGVNDPSFTAPPQERIRYQDLPEPKYDVVREYDGVPAVLSVWGPDGLICASDNFILASIDETDQEKMSMVFTFGDPVMFGGTERQPRLYSYSGFLVDTEKSGPGSSYWRTMYERYFRGSACAEKKAVIELLYRDQWRLGYMVGTRPSLSSDRPQLTPFSFVLFVIDEGHS